MKQQDMQTGHMRQDSLTGRWIIYAPGRSERPNEEARRRNGPERTADKRADCPFCPGNEAMLPPIIHEEPGESGVGWRTRVVPNKFPVVSPDARPGRVEQNFQITSASYGRHEVIIETPFHNRDIRRMSRQQVETLMRTYCARQHAAYSEDPRINSVLIFRNHGPAAGTSLRHPHSQLIATAVVPDFIAQRERLAREYFQRNKRCSLCDMLAAEVDDDRRIVRRSTAFVTLVPFAAEAPFECWIVPSGHNAGFCRIAESEKTDLADTLRDALERLDRALDDPDYNYIVNSFSPKTDDTPHLHWFLQIRPRVTTPAGFEIGSGMRINPSLPEHDAAILRQS